MNFILLGVYLVASFAAASMGQTIRPGEWYKQKVRKPSWTPPNWLFPIAWTTIYTIIAIAGARVAPLEGSQYAVAFWSLQIALNAVWTPTFFGARQFKRALVIIIALWLTVLGCLITHYQLDLYAGLMFVPYVAWLTLATALNYSIVQLNPNMKPLEFNAM